MLSIPQLPRDLEGQVLIPEDHAYDEARKLSSTGRRNAVWPVTLKLGSDELTFWVTAAVVVEARPEGGPERR